MPVSLNCCVVACTLLVCQRGGINLKRVIETTSEVQTLENARYALITYYNYIKAWVISINRIYGSGDDGISAFIVRIKSLANFKRIQRGTSSSPELVNAYNRGRLTLSAIHKLPVDENPELAISANFWLPVQSYYSIHGVGLASLIALNWSPPKDHRSFRNCFSLLARKYFPIPLCGRCDGGPTAKDFVFPELTTNATEVIKQSNITNPESVEGDAFVGKSLSSTRWRILEDLLKQKRKEGVKRGCKRRNLTDSEKQTTCEKLHATSVCDFIYRMRVHSNYDNPDMYLFAADGGEEAANHYKNLRYLTEVVVAGLETLIERGIGDREMAVLKSRFEQ